jgi:hypothetical protein
VSSRKQAELDAEYVLSLHGKDWGPDHYLVPTILRHVKALEIRNAELEAAMLAGTEAVGLSLERILLALGRGLGKP